MNLCQWTPKRVRNMDKVGGSVTQSSCMKARLSGGAASRVFSGMATLVLGSSVSRVIGIAAIPVLTRLYSPEDFGVLAVFTALVAILAPLVTLRFVLAIPLPRHDGLALNVAFVAVIAMLISTVLFSAAMLFWAQPLLEIVSMEDLVPWWWLIPICILGTAGYEALSLWATRMRSYRIIALTNVTQSAAGAATMIILGLLALQPLGLLIGRIVAQSGGMMRMMREFLNQFRAERRHLSLRRMRKVAWRYRGFPIWRVPSQFLTVFAAQAPLLFMGALFNAHITGQLGLAVMALAVPVGIIGNAAGQALLGEASAARKQDPGRILEMCLKTQIRLFLLALGPAAILFLFGEPIFVGFFGAAWSEAGVFASFLSLALVFQFTSSPLVQVVALLEDQSVMLLMNIVRVVGLVGLFLVAKASGLEPVSTIAAYSWFSACFYLLASIVIIWLLSKEFRQTGPV
jgi:O-antigen/teichoic acid export membrane protein